MNPYELAVLLLDLATRGLEAAIKLRETAAQSAEWTPQEEANFDAKLDAARTGALAHWRVEPDPGVPTPDPAGAPPPS